MLKDVIKKQKKSPKSIDQTQDPGLEIGITS